jgi:hypothetical protein
MILARGPDSASADEPGIDVRAPLPHVVRRTPRPLHPCRPASAEARNRVVGPASNPFPSGLLPSGISMAKPAIQQARDRAEVLWGATRPEWVTSAGSLERPSRDAGIGRAFCRQQPLGTTSFAIICAGHTIRWRSILFRCLSRRPGIIGAARTPSAATSCWISRKNGFGNGIATVIY